MAARLIMSIRMSIANFVLIRLIAMLANKKYGVSAILGLIFY